jgi:peptide/nickel transport system substrate-binding protein
LHFESTIWAYKANLNYVGRADQFTMAMQVKPAK